MLNSTFPLDGHSIETAEASHRAEPRFRVVRWWRKLQTARRIRGTERALYCLSDRTLKDIGLTRSEIPTAARQTYRTVPGLSDLNLLGWPPAQP